VRGSSDLKSKTEDNNGPSSSVAPRPSRPSGANAGRSLTGYLLILPLLALVAGLTLYPTVVTTVEAFFRVSPLYPKRFVGFENFRDIFGDAGTRVSLINTVLYCAFGVTLSTLLGVAIAHRLKSPFRFRGAILALVVLPWAIPSVVGAVIWGWIFDATFGVLNGMLTSLHILDDYHVWLGVHRVLTVFLIEVVQVWQITPLSIIIVMAALQNIPSDVREAAVIDGASGAQIFRLITLPLIRPALAVAVVQSVVLSVNIFDQAYVLNSTATSGSSIMLKTYQVTFSNLDFGQGYALSLVATALTALITVATVALIYRRVSY
jgi:multiple sugar transport system permease protein